MCFKCTITLICFLHLNANVSQVDVISQMMLFPSRDTAAPGGANTHTHTNILKKLCAEQRSLQIHTNVTLRCSRWFGCFKKKAWKVSKQTNTASIIFLTRHTAAATFFLRLLGK